MANPIRIKKHLKIGDLDAEADWGLLKNCFVEKGDLAILMDVAQSPSVILGRTGSGKSALLLRMQELAENSSYLDPHDISIRYLEYSNIIQFFNELGIKLDLFYRLLWRHILAVELLKKRYDISNESDNRTVIDRLLRLIGKNQSQKKAFEYFSEWGDKFWLDVEEQLKELTEKFANNVKAELGSALNGVALSVEGAKSLDRETRTEISQRASQVVSSIQIQKLNQVVKSLQDHAFQDRQKKYYVLIDKLDEDWASTETRCRFIRALIEEIKYFRNIKQVKIVAALRTDLLNLVFDKTRDAGFQEEKYEAYMLNVRWSRDDLNDLVDQRINEVFRRQYTQSGVKFEDIFPKPKKGGGGTAREFIFERTLLRPRDVLQYINECFSLAFDRERISWRVVLAAEANYSSKRLKSLKEEWSEFYPQLETVAEVLRGMPDPFTRSALTDVRLDELILALHEGDQSDPVVRIAREYFYGEGGVKKSDVASMVFAVLYHVGALGMKVSTLDTFVWSYVDQPRISRGEVRRVNQIKVHKMLHRALEIRKAMTAAIN